MLTSLSLTMLWLASRLHHVAADNAPGTFAEGGDTLVGAMMVRTALPVVCAVRLIEKMCQIELFLGNQEKVYIIDKAERNAAQINGHPAWASVW